MNTIYDPASRSQKLTEILQEKIKNSAGVISFAEYMEAVLYHPELGYYNAPNFNLGKNGDYTTASEISSLYAKCFAQQCAAIFKTLGYQNILEIGAGTGHFARDLISSLFDLSEDKLQYFIYEKSPLLESKQKNELRKNSNFYSHIKWVKKLPQNFKGIIIANEVLDALPVHCFKIEEGEVKEKCVGWEVNHFTWSLKTPPKNSVFEKKTKELLNRYEFSSGYESEINLNLSSFIQSLADSLHTGIILLADYGYGRGEYYHPQRYKGTLTCFHQHKRSENPFLMPGLQDITAHVDFTKVIEDATDAGLQLAGFTSQAAFLLSCGLVKIAEEEEKKLLAIEKVNFHQAIKLLTFPSEMGECVKIMALKKNFAGSLLGFSFQDLSRNL